MTPAARVERRIGRVRRSGMRTSTVPPRPRSARTATTVALVVAAGLTGLTGCGPAGSPTGGQTGGQAAPSAGSSQAATPTEAPRTQAPRTPVSAPPPGINLVDAGYTGRFRAWATVLEKGSGGPQLCVGAIATSYPPQCGGPPVVGWDWSKARHEERSGVRWGAYVVVGRFDGTRFTLSGPAVVDDGSGPRPQRPAERDFTSPCPAPAGGWVPPDPARATDDAMNQLTLLAPQQPGYAALWLDQNLGATPTASPSGGDNDPRRIIVNVSTTGDVTAMEQALRKVWGGNLCVVPGPRTEAELRRVQTALEHAPGMLESGADSIGGWVDLTVVRATRQYQQQLDDTYGAGLVRLIGALEPVD